MRDDRYVLTRAERRQARADWRDVPSRERVEAVRRAKRGLAAADERVAAAARGYSRYLLQRNRTNRLPRSLLALTGALLTVVGVLLWSGVMTVFGEVATGLGVFVTSGGVVVVLMGLVSWSQRQGAALLLAAEPDTPAVPQGRQTPSGGAGGGHEPRPETAR